MLKKHFLCTHHFVSYEDRDQYFENCKNIPSKRQFARAKSEHLQDVQHWIGIADFWFCQCIADNDQAIFDFLDKLGSTELLTTLPVKWISSLVKTMRLITSTERTLLLNS